MPRYLSDDLPAPLRASMGIWAEQIDEDFAAIDRMSAAGELWALIGFRDDLARWVRTSPCPNALAQAVEYADAKIAVTTMRPMIAGGTPNSFTKRAMRTVAAFAPGVSLPPSDAPWTPISAL